jgi:Xaa-Pro dipeptidase
MDIARELAFSQEEYDARLARARARMAAENIEVLLVHTPANQCYLTGFQTLNLYDYSCLVLPIDGAPFIQVLDMEEGNVSLTSRMEDVVTYTAVDNPVTITQDVLRGRGLLNRRIGIEADTPFLTPRRYDALSQVLPNLVDASDLVKMIRLLKSSAEIGYVRQAARVTEAGMQAGLDAIGEGVTDQDVARACYEAMIGGGSEYMCIDPIITTGRRSGIPHTSHKRHAVQPGDNVFIELGACIERYSAPIMRTAVLGSPSANVQRTTEASFASLDNAMAAMKPGVSGDEVARAGWAGIEMDRSEVFFHGVVAYSIGLGFPPNWGDYRLYLTKGEETLLEAGMLFHLPIAIRDVGNYCVGFSETVVITETGCEQITQYERQLFRR